jgi:glycosidase
MKKLLIICVALLALAGCKKTKTPSVHPDWTYSSVMYEVNIRQFSPEGTFAGVEAQLPRLKELGVDILWLMPMYEIGTEGRKGTLGSYYAISDYNKVNPEFGTMEDF